MSCCGNGSSFTQTRQAPASPWAPASSVPPATSANGGVFTGGAQTSAPNTPIPQPTPRKTGARPVRTFVG
jgi:hypothetical protein